jgi:hypothetical protein
MEDGQEDVPGFVYLLISKRRFAARGEWGGEWGHIELDSWGYSLCSQLIGSPVEAPQN